MGAEDFFDFERGEPDLTRGSLPHSSAGQMLVHAVLPRTEIADGGLLDFLKNIDPSGSDNRRDLSEK